MQGRYPPLTAAKRKLANRMFVVPLAFSRPTSVEGEKAARRRARLLKWLAAVTVVLAAAYFGRSVVFEIGGWY